MEKSIEHMWNEGFSKDDALKAPQIHNLPRQKSIHIIDKFKRMFKINLIAIIVFSFVFLSISYFLHILIMGIIFFTALSVLVVINKRLLSGLEQIDKGQNSYGYLRAFYQWMKMQIKVNEQIARFLYPIIFLSLVLGLWFNDAEDVYLGERLVNKILLHFPDTYLVFGIPLIGIVFVVIALGLLAFLGHRIYRWDFNLIYGRIFKKLEELIADIESLND